MHSCLRVAEIFQAIVDNVPDSGSLVRIALTCHAFHESAMDTLWHTLDDLRPLILLLPREYLGKTESESLLVRIFSLFFERSLALALRYFYLI